MLGLIGSWRIEEDSFLTIDYYTHVQASTSSTCDINNACMFGIPSEYACKRGVIACNIHCIFFPTILLIASCVKTRNSQSKESRIQNQSYGMTKYKFGPELLKTRIAQIAWIPYADLPSLMPGA